MTIKHADTIILGYLIASMVTLYPLAIVIAPLTVGLGKTSIFTFGLKIAVSIVSCFAIFKAGVIKKSVGTIFIYSFFLLYILNIIIFAMKNPVFLYSSPVMYVLNLVVNIIIPVLLIKVFEKNSDIIKATLSFILFLSPIYLLVTSYFLFYIFNSGNFEVLSDRDSDLYVSPINLAYPASFMGAVFFDKFVNERAISWRGSLFNLSLGLLALAIVVVSGTRGALVALLFATLLSFFVFNSEVRLKKIVMVVGIAIALASLVFSGSFEFQLLGRIQSLIYLLTSGDFSSEARYQIMYQAYQEWTIRPLFGGSLYLSSSGMYPHNIILDVLLSTGVVGFILFSGFILSIFIKLVHLQLSPAMRLIVIGVIVNLVMLSFSQTFIVAYNLFVFLALLSASADSKKVLD